MTTKTTRLALPQSSFLAEAGTVHDLIVEGEIDRDSALPESRRQLPEGGGQSNGCQRGLIGCLRSRRLRDGNALETTGARDNKPHDDTLVAIFGRRRPVPFDTTLQLVDIRPHINISLGIDAISPTATTGRAGLIVGGRATTTAASTRTAGAAGISPRAATAAGRITSDHLWAGITATG